MEYGHCMTPKQEELKYEFNCPKEWLEVSILLISLTDDEIHDTALELSFKPIDGIYSYHCLKSLSIYFQRGYARKTKLYYNNSITNIL